MEGNNVKSFENLCKIFEMRIKLDREKKIKTPIDVIANYEKYAKKIDNIYNEDFEKEIRSLMAPSKTIEAEKDRLEKLITLLENRLAEREDLENRFYLAVGEYITGLQMIVSEKELDDKKERLELINRYLDTNDEIDSVNESILKLKELLAEEEDKKEDYKTKNQIMEDDLYSEFSKVMKEESFDDINEENISNELNNLSTFVIESKETLDVTKESVRSLITSGADSEYSSYIEEAEKNYYVVKNKELLLKIYKLVINFEDTFNNIFTKRDNIRKLIDERKELIRELNITNIDILMAFENKLLEQINVVKKEKEVIENISNYTSRIEFKEARLEELEENNNQVEILAILREFNLIDTYDNDEFDVSLLEKEEINEEEKEKIVEEPVELEEVIEEPPIKKVIDPYGIKEIKDAPVTLNLGLAKLKGESVREKVNRKLNPKKEEKREEFTTVIENTLPEESTDNKVEEVNVQNNEEDLPTWDIPNESELENKSIPTWKLPTEEIIDKISIPSEEKQEIPEWNPTAEPSKIIPIWDSIKPEEEEISNIDLNLFEQPQEAKSDNVFWTQISDEKLENNAFPDAILGNNFNNYRSDNFDFPNLDNN